MRWRPGRPGKRSRQNKPPVRVEAIAWRSLLVGVGLSLIQSLAALFAAFVLLSLVRLPLFAGYAAVMPLLALGNAAWAPRDRAFYVSMGGMIALWLVGALALASAA